MSTKQLEIDGEFFENPVELARVRKEAAIAMALARAHIAITQAQLIASQPLFPRMYKHDGDIVKVNHVH